MTSDTVLRTGVLFKKGSGQGPFGRRNWKPRYFVLTPRKLSYYTYEDGELKGEVDLSGCTDQSIEVMPADSMKTGSSASTIWRIAINAADRRLIVAAGTEMEMNDWVEQLLVAFHVNSGQPLPQRRSVMQAPGAIPAPGAIANTHADGDVSRNSITDFQNFAAARRSVGGAVRASLGTHPGQEFRLSDEQERLKQAEQQRLEEQRQLAEMEAERLRQEELLQAHLRSQAEERRKEKERLEALQQAELLAEQQHQEEERLRVEAMLEEQRRLKREQHERERQEAERQLRELELQEQEKRDELEIQRHLDEDRVEVEILRRPAANQSPPPPPGSPMSSPVVAPPTAPSPPPRSSLIGDAKKEAMLRQQNEHNKRREASIKEHQEQMRQDFLAQQGVEPSRASHAARSPPRGDASRQQLSSQTSVEF